MRGELQARGHTFRSLSDTEVILAAYREWGIECLARLHGMFAFALHDAAAKTVFLARDRAGEKPLFYTLGNGVLRFASELKGLLADPAQPRHIDHNALALYLLLGYVPGEHCILRGASKLPAAHALVFELRTGAVRTWRYWQLPPPVQAGATGASDSELLDEAEALL